MTGPTVHEYTDACASVTSRAELIVAAFARMHLPSDGATALALLEIAAEILKNTTPRTTLEEFKAVASHLFAQAGEVEHD